jgi:hypothetical protein
VDLDSTRRSVLREPIQAFVRLGQLPLLCVLRASAAHTYPIYRAALLAVQAMAQGTAGSATPVGTVQRGKALGADAAQARRRQREGIAPFWDAFYRRARIATSIGHPTYFAMRGERSTSASLPLCSSMLSIARPAASAAVTYSDTGCS